MALLTPSLARRIAHTAMAAGALSLAATACGHNGTTAVVVEVPDAAAEDVLVVGDATAFCEAWELLPFAESGMVLTEVPEAALDAISDSIPTELSAAWGLALPVWREYFGMWVAAGGLEADIVDEDDAFVSSITDRELDAEARIEEFHSANCE